MEGAVPQADVPPYFYFFNHKVMGGEREVGPAVAGGAGGLWGVFLRSKTAKQLGEMG